MTSTPVCDRLSGEAGFFFVRRSRIPRCTRSISGPASTVNDGTDERCDATEHLMRPDAEVDFTLLARAIFREYRHDNGLGGKPRLVLGKLHVAMMLIDPVPAFQPMSEI